MPGERGGGWVCGQRERSHAAACSTARLQGHPGPSSQRRPAPTSFRHVTSSRKMAFQPCRGAAVGQMKGRGSREGEQRRREQWLQPAASTRLAAGRARASSQHPPQRLPSTHLDVGAQGEIHVLHRRPRVPAARALNARQAPHACAGERQGRQGAARAEAAGGAAQQAHDATSRPAAAGAPLVQHPASPRPAPTQHPAPASRPIPPAVPLKLKKEREAECVYCSHRMW